MSRKRARPDRPLVEFRAVSKRFGPVHAVGPVSFGVRPGEVVALVGHNGSGKSTLLGTGAGALEPSEGEVKIGRARAGEPAARAAVSFLRDRPVLYDDLSLNEQLEYLSRLHGSSPERHDSRALLDELGLSDRADDLPSVFSRGLRQKAAIAIGFCRPFALLLADEPFSALDRDGRAALVRLMDRTRRENGAVLVATHDETALEMVDRVIVLDHGLIVHDGSPDDIPSARGETD